MVSVFLREQKRYTQNELVELFQCSEPKAVKVIKRLKEYGVVKAVKANDIQKELTDLYETDVEIADVEEGENEYLYVFPFVGVVTLEGMVLKCFPKYISKTVNPVVEMKQVLKVLSKYNSKEEIIRMYNDSSDSSAFNMLAVMLYLLHDYHEYGPYTNTEDIIEINGNGDILWDKTINETFTLISAGRPYYPEMMTKKTVVDDYDYFKRLHECIISICSKELKEADLLDLFDVAGVDVSDEELADFGEDEFILEAIEKELNVQFNTRKQLLLKTLYAYVLNNGKAEGLDCFSMFGTNSFNLVWEKICAEVLQDKLHTKIELLNLGRPLNQQYFGYRRKPLIELISKPKWTIHGKSDAYETDTLIPDLVTVGVSDNKGYFAIFDAKYYCMKTGKNLLTGNPGIESVNKQYLYQLAYRDFISAHELVAYNCFLFPTEKTEIIDMGSVSFEIFKSMNLQDIQLKLLPANIMYDLYLTGRHMNAITLMTNQ